MPRTKVKRSTAAQKNKNNDEVNFMIVRWEEQKQKIRDTFDRILASSIDAIVNKHLEKSLNIPKKYMSMKLSEVAKIESFSTTSTAGTTISKESVLEVLTMKSKKKTKTRSSSCVDDEGYLTTDSGSGPRASRSRTKKVTQNKRMTRSLSRTENKTPMNKPSMPESYGLITPKVKPNTPLVLVRRPRAGEMVLSVKGSPLLAAPPVESMANINIPLVDGTLLSLQAQAGLRRSQIPDLDPEVKRQLQMLRQHLDIMVPGKGGL